jgi:hypothetical protein
MSRIVVETPPDELCVDLDEMKRHLRVRADFTDDDDDITAYTKAATRNVENFLNKALINTGFRQSHDNFPYYVDPASSPQANPPSLYSIPRYASTAWNYSQQIKLLRSPVQKVSKITYVGADNLLHDLLPDPEYDFWQPQTKFSIGDQITDPNRNLQEVTGAADPSTTGDNAPAFSATPGGTINDSHVQWTCKAVPAPAGDFVVDRDNIPARIFPKPGGVWPAALYVPNAVRIHFVAGYGEDVEGVPEDYRVAVKLWTAMFYEFREPISSLGLKEVPLGIRQLLWNDRDLDFAPTRG